MKKTLQAVVAASTLLVAMSASAQSYNITFDTGDPINGLAFGATLANQYAAFGVTFSPNAFSGAGNSSTGEDWATNTNMGIVSSTGTDVCAVGAPSLVGSNLLHSFNGWLNENGDPSFRASFVGGITAFSAAFAGATVGADVRLFAYSGATLLGSVAGVGSGQFSLAFAAPNITSIVVTPGSFADWVGVDNIQYTLAPIPEPGTYALMGLGLCAVAWARRRAAARA